MSDTKETLCKLLDVELDKRDYTPRDVEIKPINMNGANYSSQLFLVEVSSPNKKDLKLFAKVSNINDALRNRMCADWLFANERFVYNKLTKVYDDLQDKHEVPQAHRLKFPGFYGCSDEHGKETVIMENLVASGYKSFSRFESMDWEYAKAGVLNLAKFHALSLAYATEYPEEFGELAATMKYELGKVSEEEVESMKPLWMNLINGALAVVKDDQKEKVGKFLAEGPQLWQYNCPRSRAVLTHGDYRLSNLLFKNLDNSVEAISVDFQTVHAGCPAADLIYFIFLGSDEKFRAQYYDKLVDFYYSSLCEAMDRLGVDAAEAYSRKMFDSDMKETMPYAVLLGAMVLPVVTVEADSVPDVEKDREEAFIISPNELFAQRFSGIVNDCVKWNVI